MLVSEVLAEAVASAEVLSGLARPPMGWVAREDDPLDPACPWAYGLGQVKENQPDSSLR